MRIKNVGIYQSLCPTFHIIFTHSCDLWASRCLVEEPRLFDHKCVRRTHDLTHMCVKSAFQSSCFLFILTLTTIFYLSLKFAIFYNKLVFLQNSFFKWDLDHFMVLEVFVEVLRRGCFQGCRSVLSKIL